MICQGRKDTTMVGDNPIFVWGKFVSHITHDSRTHFCRCLSRAHWFLWVPQNRRKITANVPDVLANSAKEHCHNIENPRSEHTNLPDRRSRDKTIRTRQLSCFQIESVSNWQKQGFANEEMQSVLAELNTIVVRVRLPNTWTWIERFVLCGLLKLVPTAAVRFYCWFAAKNRPQSNQNVANYIPWNIRKPVIATAITIGQLFVIQPHAV